ncbi:(2Fe-2S) ferredoxin domain-containing protein [Solitalea canadensis]|uniref:Ferredoxin n=1 Tax=Solitalea canadensis (strain ATCC 29591 / DSM 3403 / JCM 21819 / LMG 8368 / NBRC 15130 / NCIMB 12057 / USAM 9D) TaxID=929556 RepID=H8KNL5_SOLCM|nr:(2Fe-2S) ferredoxin domain-containing protein [Solitalea canadensis]AFD08148.1 ferredoxin [Solitalea canadensis DSM 3403]
MEHKLRYSKHIFVCTNERAPGTRVCCGEKNGLALVAAFKKVIKDKGLSTEVRAQKAGCLETCELGPSVVVYPEGIFYGKVQLEDVEEIVNEHILNNRVVERLVMDMELLDQLQAK